MRDLLLYLSGFCIATGLIAMLLVKLGDMGEQPPTCQAPSPDVAGTTYYCTLLLGHEELHEAVGMGIVWDDSHEPYYWREVGK